MGMVLHIPHSSRAIPEEYKKVFLEGVKVEEELDRITDVCTEELYNFPYPKLVFPCSRLVCDVERFLDPEQEPMTEKGTFGTEIKQLTEEHILDVVEGLYKPHHEKLTAMVEEELEKDGKALVVDCHSFPSYMPWLDKQHWGDIDICIGMDPYHTPWDMVIAAMLEFAKEGYYVKQGAPFDGALVPLKFFEKDKRVMGIMLEINRSLYYDDYHHRKKPEYFKLRSTIGKVLQKLSAMI